MKTIFCIISCSLFFAAHIIAQPALPRFNASLSAGLAVGESTNAAILETVHGIKFSDWFAGVGAGIDFYRHRTLPLFINSKKYFGKQKAAFGYGSLGYNFPFNNKPEPQLRYYESYHFSGGIYADAGVGYAVPLAKKSSLLFSLGYSYKELNSVTTVRICPLVPPCYENQSRYEWSYGRTVMKAGITF